MSKVTYLLLVSLRLAALLTGCSSGTPHTTVSTLVPTQDVTEITPTMTPLPPTPESTDCVRPGIHLTNDPSHLPLPTSGYQLYVIGEPHGQKEVRDLTFSYLVKLYKEAGVRDIILEQIPSFYETEVNAYVLGVSDTIRGNWHPAADILIDIRKYNDELPGKEKIHVHLPDLDMAFSTIYFHLRALHEEVVPDNEILQIPLLSELKTWEEEELLTLVDALAQSAHTRGDIADECETVADSIRWHFVTSRMEKGELSTHEFIDHEYIRETRISLNVQRLVTELDDKPVLALYGGYHIQKFPAMIVSPFGKEMFLDSASWVQRTVEAGVHVYGVFSMGLKGQEGMNTDHRSVEKKPGDIRLADGTTAEAIFTMQPDDNILYIDLRVEENHTLRLGNDFNDVATGDIFDGVVLFREVHPQEWKQYP